MAKVQYNDNAIQSLNLLEWIRLRPTASIGSIDIGGQFVLFREAFDNAVDEIEQEFTPGNNIWIWLFLDSNKKTYQIAVKDNGRGIPHGKLKDSYTHSFTSGKYVRGENAVFRGTAGVNGLGSKSIFALSSHSKGVVHRDGFYSSVYVKDGDINSLIHEENTPSTNPNIETGTLLVFEPDKKIFTEIDKFIEEGYNQVIRLCYLVSMFSKKANIVVNIINESINSKFWKLPANEAFNYIEKTYSHKWVTIVDNNNREVALDYLKELWNLPTNEDFQWELTNINHPFVGKIGFDISLYLPKTLRSTNAITIVNNVPMHDTNSSHMVALITSIKNKIVNYIKNDDYKSYFLNIYKLPLCCTVAIKYTDIHFAGLAKTSFKDSNFEYEFGRMLDTEFNKVFDYEWENLYNAIAKDIEIKYSVYYNKPLNNRKASKAALDIIQPKYYDCNTSDRSIAELFIVEGVSASHITEARDPETQALFMIYGKPKNVFKTGSVDLTSLQVFQKYEAYRQLEDILNIHPKQEDLSSAAFSKIILMNDADIDGGHIQALHIGGLYSLNPRIITSGMVYIANPPLYEVAFGNNENRKYRYIQDKNSLIRFFIDCLYRNTFEISIMDGKAFKVPTLLDSDGFTDFCYIITELGELFEHLSARLAVPPFILEQLTYITPYIQTGKVNRSKIIEHLGENCYYDYNTDILTVIGKKQDYSFAVSGICEAFYEELFGYLHKLCWKDLKIFVTTKYTNALQNTRMSITQIYEMFLQLNKTLHVRRQKGLGGMDAEDLKPLCMNKETRVLHQITSLGDYQKIQDLLGDDVKARKEILRQHGLESD